MYVLSVGVGVGIRIGVGVEFEAEVAGKELLFEHGQRLR
jgi:hypothetical protein